MKNFVGKVVSTNGKNTAAVELQNFIVHPKYKKRLSRTSRFLIHDELGLTTGDMVEFVETRPISKMKRWKAVKKVK